MYVAVKGGERAIAAAHRLQASRRRGERTVPAIRDNQVREQLGLAVSRVMAEGSCHDLDLASLAIRQAQGDLIEAIFLVRAYRTTLPRFGYTVPLETGAMRVERRVSATFKDLPGGQVLGPTFDYTHRLIDFALAADGEVPEALAGGAGMEDGDEPCPRVTDILGHEGLIEDDDAGDGTGEDEPGDLTREPMEFPTARDVRLQALARGDEGFLLALGYSTQRGYARTHPFVGEIRIGTVKVALEVPELGLTVTLGAIEVTECQMVSQFVGGGRGEAAVPPQFTRGYGLVFGRAERKAMSMSLVDRAMRHDEFDEEVTAPAQDHEFALAHADNVAATGFVEHLKLPHYVDFQAELDLIRRLRAEWEERGARELRDDLPEAAE